MEAVEDMALPDTLTFAWADKATLNPCSNEKFGKCSDLSLSLWKVAAD
jgi:hypothetical protein